MKGKADKLKDTEERLTSMDMNLVESVAESSRQVMQAVGFIRAEVGPPPTASGRRSLHVPSWLF